VAKLVSKKYKENTRVAGCPRKRLQQIGRAIGKQARQTWMEMLDRLEIDDLKVGKVGI